MNNAGAANMDSFLGNTLFRLDYYMPVNVICLTHSVLSGKKVIVLDWIGHMGDNS
jgi:hypothetical protein